MDTITTLVLGGTGKTGRRVAKRLADKGLALRIGSRSAVPPFDWTDRNTWESVLDGVSRAYVTFQPDLAVPGAAETIGSFAALAAERGVRRLVLLTGRGEPGAQRSEEALKNTVVDWTILRASWFNQNFSENFFLDGILAGELALPAGDIPEPFVDADDIAEVAVAALLDDRHVGRVYELTGSRALTFAEAVDTIADASGRTIHYRRIPHRTFLDGLAAASVPQEFIDLLDELFSVVLDGRNSPVMEGVQEVLGRQALDFTTYARATAAAGIWNATP